jgi:hypothetical protein
MPTEGDALVRYVSAVTRFYVVQDPTLAESKWRSAHEFAALSDQDKRPGHCYQFASGSGYIVIDANCNGEWTRELPSSIDPATVIKVPAIANAPTLMDNLRLNISRAPASRRRRLQPLVDSLIALTKSRHDAATVQNFVVPAMKALPKGTDSFISLLGASAREIVEDKFPNGNATGREAAAIILIREIGKAVSGPDSTGGKPSAVKLGSLFGKMLSPGPATMGQVACRFIHDCIVSGFQDQTLGALEKIRSEGRQALDGFRDNVMTTVDDHATNQSAIDFVFVPTLTRLPEIALSNYYFALFHAAPLICAAMAGFQAVSQMPGIDPSVGRRATVEANVAEELLVRILDGLFFEVRNANGAALKALVDELRALRSAGKLRELDARINDAINKFYVPRPFKSYLSSQSQAPP